MTTYNQTHIIRLREINAMAEQGDADAQFTLGKWYYDGYIVHKDDKDALRWFLAAGKQGHAEAQFSLGVMYINGEEVARNEFEVVIKGEAVPRNKHEALIWFLVANANGHEKADNALFLTAIGLSEEFVDSVKDEAKRRFPEIEDWYAFGLS